MGTFFEGLPMRVVWFVISLFVCWCGATTSGELTALSELYYACDGDNWINNTNWLNGDPCDTPSPWYGVSCSNNHITELMLSENSLYGEIPSSFDNLYELATLYLYNNDIFGTIPSNWNQLKSLQKIDIHGNGFSGSIPN